MTLSRDGADAAVPDAAATAATPRRLTSSSGIDTEPVFAPDGAQHLLRQRPRRRPADLPHAARRRRRSSASPSTAATTSARRSAPTASTLAYISRQGGGLQADDAWTSPAAAPQTLTDTSDDESPSFAPNGRLIVYATRVQGRDVLMTTTLDGKIKTRLLTSGADMREPAWGPFGR